MFTEAQTAIVCLQQMASAKQNIYWLERIDRAIDECVAHPERIDPASFQCRSALANAKKVIDRRRAIRQWESVDQRDVASPRYASEGTQYSIVEWVEWLRTNAGISPSSRRLLLQVAQGHHAEDLATLYGQPLTTMRQRISRARSAARAVRALDRASGSCSRHSKAD
jgi:DNA-directed RNA polymerase specialized sigma24 family protein